MAVIHLTGSIALFLFGGVIAFLGGNNVSYQMNCDTSRYVCNSDFGGYATLLIGIGMIIGGIVLAMKSSKPAQESEELKDYEDKYLARQGIKSTSRKPTARRKPAETRESENNFCDNCGKSLRPTAKFCSGCGSPRS